MLLIDGDVAAHMCCPSRWKDSKGNTVIMHDKSEKVFTKEEEAKYLQVAYNTFNSMLENMLESNWESDFLMGMKHPSNFRDEMYPGYKKNRYKDTNTFNNFVPIIRQLAVYENKAIWAEGAEVDDYIGIWTTQCEEAGIDVIIATIDKDLRTIPGKHYHMKEKTLEIVTPIMARRFYYQQLLMGDATDNIPGIPRIGPKKAEAALKDCYEKEEFQEAVVSMYETAFGREWYEYLMSNGKMLHIMRKPDDYFSCRDWEYVKYLQSQSIEPFYTPGFVEGASYKICPEDSNRQESSKENVLVELSSSPSNIPKVPSIPTNVKATNVPSFTFNGSVNKEKVEPDSSKASIKEQIQSCNEVTSLEKKVVPSIPNVANLRPPVRK